jgi:aryl-alcohol dehydrogenase-like predicted oxidoreductase
MMNSERRRVGPWQVAPIGLGCMNLSHAYGEPVTAEQGEAVLHAALDAGVDFFDTAALYGFGANETLVGRVLQPHRDRIVLCSKGGMAGVTFADGVKRVIDGRPEAIRRNCEDSLQRLGSDVIDLYYLHRHDPQVPIEDSVGEMSRLQEEGKIRALGLSEVGADLIRRAHAIHPIAAVQTEYSLWTRNPEIAVLHTCDELGIAFVAFSPVARGFLAGGVSDVASLLPKDIRRSMPRFEPGNVRLNQRLLEGLRAIGSSLGVTPAQLCLAWLMAQAPNVIPIPGTTRIDHLQEDLAAAQVTLSTQTLRELNALFPPGAAAGPRYNAATQAEVFTEDF